MTIVYTRSPALLSRFIMWMQGGRCSHVGIGTQLHGIAVVVHADWKVRITPRTHFLVGRSVVKEFLILRDVGEGLRHAIEMVDEDYDIVGAFGFGLVALAWKWFKKKIRNPIASPKAVVCSEFVAMLGLYGEIPSLRGLDTDSMLPEPLLELTENSPEDFKEIAQ